MRYDARELLEQLTVIMSTSAERKPPVAVPKPVRPPQRSAVIGRPAAWSADLRSGPAPL